MTTTRLGAFNLINLLDRQPDRQAPRRPLRHGRGDAGVADWIPAVDVLEQKDRYLLRADLPGVNAEDIDVRMEDGILSLTGTRHRDADEQVDGVRRFERATGKFLRRFSLPETTDAENITARSSNGTLEVSIPKLPEVQARRITVEAA